MNKINKFLIYFKDKKSQLLILLLLVLLTTIINVGLPYLTAITIDNYIANQDKTGLNTIVTISSIIFIFLAFFSYNSTMIVGTMSQTVLHELRMDLFKKVQQFPMAFFIQNNSGDIISRLNNDTRKLDNFLSRYIFEFISTFFTFLGIGIFIFVQNIPLAMVTWLLIIILIIFSYLVGPIVSNTSKQQLQVNGDITTYLNDNITNYKAVVAFNQQTNIGTRYEKLVRQNFSLSFKSKMLTAMFRYIYNFAGIMSQGMVLGTGVYLVSQGQLTSGVLIAFILYVQRFYEPIVRLAAVFGSYQQAMGAWTRILEVIELSPESGDYSISQSKSHLESDIDE
jgi:ATP-binding cassette, subfamily B, bacterial